MRYIIKNEINKPNVVEKSRLVGTLDLYIKEC